MKLFKKSIKKFVVCSFVLFSSLTFGVKKSSSLNVKAEQKSTKQEVEKLKKQGKTTYDFVLDLIKKNKTDEEIIKVYYNTPNEIIAELIKNERLSKIKEKKEIVATNEEKTKLERVIKKIKEKEVEFVKKYISLPKKQNKDNPIVIINPGHGFEDPGCCFENPYYNKAKEQKSLDINKIDVSLNKKFKRIDEKILNQLLSYELVLKLLKANYEVYLVYDLVELYEHFNLKLPKNNPSLHILFNTRPPVKGYGNPSPCRMADASAFCISEIFKSLNKHYKEKYKKSPKMCSVCIHHDITPNKEDKLHGFVPYYRNPDKITSVALSNNSKNFAEIMLNNCKKVNKIKEGKDISRIATEEWVVCGPGKEIENAAALLVEVGHLENLDELKLILNPKKRNEMAAAMKKSIDEYLKVNKK